MWKKILACCNYKTMSTRGVKHLVSDSKRIFMESIIAVEPRAIIRNNVMVKNNNKLIICDKEYAIDKNCYMVGFGKAVLGMAREMERILCGHLVKAIVSVPTGIFSACPNHLETSTGVKEKQQENSREKRKVEYIEIGKSNCGQTDGTKTARTSVNEETLFREKEHGDLGLKESKITFMEGAIDNLPDASSEKAARAIFQVAGELNEMDLLIVLISGGGSALLPLPRPPVTLAEKTSLIKSLSLKGADIIELNCVRTRLSLVKGGGLARQAYPASVVGLVLSDVIGDSLHYIASGPTTASQDAPDAALGILDKYNIQVPETIRKVLSEPSNETRTDLFHVTNFVIGNNKRAATAAFETAKRLGYQAHVISTCVSGDVSEVGLAYASLATNISASMTNIPGIQTLKECLQKYSHVFHLSEDEINEISTTILTPSTESICLIAAGEPTVQVRGRGLGGRNQQLALHFAIDINNMLKAADTRLQTVKISFLSCGTDGRDGPTDAAGAVATNSLYPRAKKHNLNPVEYLENNDSYHFFQQLENAEQEEYLIRTGHTGTNVMDIHILMIDINKSQ